jgi:hypothetical protein
MSHKLFSLLYDIPLKCKYLVSTLIPISRLVKSFQWKSVAYYPSPFFHSTLCGGNLKGEGPQPPKLPPACCALHQGTWLSAQLLTPTRRIGCICVVLGIVPNGDWAVPDWNAWVIPSWGAISSDGCTKGRKLATPGADSGIAIFSRISPNISFPQQA